jgi:hypothetical protein
MTLELSQLTAIMLDRPITAILLALWLTLRPFDIHVSMHLSSPFYDCTLYCQALQDFYACPVT